MPMQSRPVQPRAARPAPEKTRASKPAKAAAVQPAGPAVFPPVAFDQAAYRDALVKAADDGIQVRLIELGWLGTVQYQASIVRDGYPVQAQLMGWIRKEIAAVEKDLANIDRMGNEQAERLLNLRRQRGNTESSMARKPSYGTEKVLQSFDKQITLINDWQTQSKATRAGLTDRVLPALRLLQARLEAALRYFLDHPPKREEAAPPAPQQIVVENKIVVEPTPVTLEATINTPPAAVTVSLPPRRTETSIIRDEFGNISKASQLETDAEAA
ncbi:MAG: hypothetical protein FD187_2358 [bacterium]|nr:MAG: hypothetical protein FD142_1001 [bacterium]KAF0147927.1 MAG: hypothetical protein FD187_2358 [bacterium]KAF0168109.1 MAG: hypothetical protein FD158_1657 [bacterium]TXT22568.1 MAG: hypothetical protein FD132_378 [bacterium]